MDPTRSGLHRSANRMGQIVNRNVNVFTIETAVNNRMYGGMLDFLHKNEDRFNDWDRARVKGFQVDAAQSVRRSAAQDPAPLLPRRSA